MTSRFALFAAAVLGLGLAAAMPAEVHAAKAKAAAGKCTTHRGKGWGFTEGQAKFQAWEIIGQTTGNWPIITDTYKNERYKCAPDGNGVTCYSSIDVCKS
jgi:hypothetical protein